MTQASDGAPNSRPTREEVIERFESLSRRGPAQLLGVPLNADAPTARTAFLRLARRYHPDVLLPQDQDLRNQVHAIFIALDEACRHFGGHRSGRAVQKLATAPTTAVAPPAAQPASAPAPTKPRAGAAQPTRPAVAATIPARSAQKAEADAARADAAQAEAIVRRERLTQALESAATALQRGDAHTAVVLLQGAPADDERARSRVRLMLARAYVSDPRWRRYGLGLLHEMTQGPVPDAGAHLALSELYAREGRLARAEAELAKAVEIDPGQQEARRELQRIREERARQQATGPAAPKGGLLDRLRLVGR